MSLRLLPVLLLAFLAAPVALAQGPATANPTLTIDLDPSFTTNDTIAVLPFTVNLSVSQFACVGSGASFTVALTADSEELTSGNGSKNVTGTPEVRVSPSQLTFQATAGQGLAQEFSGSQPATLTISPSTAGWASNVTTTVTGEVTGISNCAGAQVNAASATAATTTTFEAPSFADQGDDQGQEMPGLGLVALLSALGVAFLLRRKA